MKCFISYRFTGEDPKELEQTLRHICNLLDSKGHNVYCSFWDSELFSQKNYTNKQILDYALKELDKSDCIVVFIKSQDKSEGSLIETGYAIAKKKRIILIIKKGIKTSFVSEMADVIIEFENLNQLKEIKV